MPNHRPTGIENRPPEHCLVAALAFTDQVADAAQAQEVVAQMRGIVQKELQSDLDDQQGAPEEQPSPETGELGFADGYDRRHLTITFGVAKSGFDRLGVPPEEQPQDLRAIPWDQLEVGGSPPVITEQGDLALQICSDDLYVCQHVLRRVEEELAGRIRVAWVQIGSQRYSTREGRTSREEGRALIGFIDGTSNLDPRHNDEDRALVYVDPDRVGEYPPLPQAQPAGYQGGADAFPADLHDRPATEPAWTRNGTYLTVRASAQDTGPWDQRTLGDQQATIGRFKFSGAFLDLSDDPARVEEAPAFEADPNNQAVAVNSHVRKVNPRRPGTDDTARRLFRRGYPLIAPGPGLQRGLLFIGFARSISTQFEFVTRAWMRNPNFPQPGTGIDRLLEIDHAICGGYYFVPAIARSRQPWSWVLPWE